MRGAFVCLFFLLDICLECAEVGLGVTSEVLASFGLRGLFHASILELGEISSVFEHFDKGVLIERVLGCLFNITDLLASYLQETLFVEASNINVFKLALGIFGLGLTLRNGSILDGDGLSHFSLVDYD